MLSPIALTALTFLLRASLDLHQQGLQPRQRGSDIPGCPQGPGDSFSAGAAEARKGGGLSPDSSLNLAPLSWDPAPGPFPEGHGSGWGVGGGLINFLCFSEFHFLNYSLPSSLINTQQLKLFFPKCDFNISVSLPFCHLRCHKQIRKNCF